MYKDINQIYNTIYKRFETNKQGYSNLFDQDTIKLNDIIEKNPNKSITQYLNILIRDISVLQYNLLLDYYSNRILYNKLLNIYKDNKVYRFVYYKTSSILISIINDLQSSIKIFKKLKQLGTYTIDTNLILDPFSSSIDNIDELDIYYIDHKYQGPSYRPLNFRL